MSKKETLRGIGEPCYYCHKTVKEKDKFVLLGTYNKEKTVSEIFFHFQCWTDYYHSSIKVNEKNLLELNKQMKKYGSILPKAIQINPMDDR